MKNDTYEDPEHEAKESPEKEKAEEKEMSEYSADSHIIPEELQEETIDLIDKCKTQECLDYIRSCLRRKEDELYKAKMKKEKKDQVPQNFSTSDMPSSAY